MAWLESLLELLGRLFRVQGELDALCEKFQINAVELFESMDTYKVGYVTSSAFARWIQINCGFQLSETDLLVLQPVFDGDRNHRIDRGEFVSAVAARELSSDGEDEIKEE